MTRSSKTTKYRRSKAVLKIRKCVRDDIRGLRDDGLTYRQIADVMRSRNERISHTTVRRIILNGGVRTPRRPYAPTSIPTVLHPTVKQLVDKLYEEESTRTTSEIIALIKEKTGVEIKRDVVATIRKELGLRHFRVRYGHAVRLFNQLLRMIYCEKKIEEGEQFLTHVVTDECYIQLGKNARTCFVKDRRNAVMPAAKHVPKILLWGGISVRGASPIKILRGKESIVDSARYQTILQHTYLDWSRETFGASAILIQDWAPAHSSLSTALFMKRSGIKILLLLCISALIICSWGDQPPCIYNIKGLKSLDNYRVESITNAYVGTKAWDCSMYNTRNYTYTLRVRQKNGNVEELDNFGCTSNTSYTYTVKGATTPTQLSDPGEVAIFCAVPMDRTCLNPFETCPSTASDEQYCPIYTGGTDSEAAKIECTEIKDAPSRWYIDGKLYDAEDMQSQPLCKAKSGENEAGFYVILPNGEEAQLDYTDLCEFKFNKYGQGTAILLTILLVPLVLVLLACVIFFARFIYKKRKEERAAAMSGAAPTSTAVASDSERP